MTSVAAATSDVVINYLTIYVTLRYVSSLVLSPTSVSTNQTITYTQATPSDVTQFITHTHTHTRTQSRNTTTLCVCATRNE